MKVAGDQQTGKKAHAITLRASERAIARISSLTRMYQRKEMSEEEEEEEEEGGEEEEKDMERRKENFEGVLELQCGSGC